MKRCVLIALLFAAGCQTTSTPGEWISLFNGENLDGWVVECIPEDAGKGYWRADNGTILCDSINGGEHDYMWLRTRQEYADFELRMKIQSYRDSTGNTGVQVRSRYDRGERWLDGPQIDIHPPGPFRCGYVYDETREAMRWIHPSLPDWEIEEWQVEPGWVWKHADEGDGWNTVRIMCKGTTIKTWVNGVPRADFDGKGILDDADHQRHNVGLNGFIALQLHTSDELRVRFKDIQLRTL